MPDYRGVRLARLPLVSDRDRIAAARYQAERLCRHMNLIAERKRLLWISYVELPNGRIVSQNQ